MNIAISDADLNYCISHGIISRADAHFFRLASQASSIKGIYKQSLDSLAGRLKYYTGISDKVVVARQQAAARAESMKRARTAMRLAYLESNSINPAV